MEQNHICNKRLYQKDRKSKLTPTVGKIYGYGMVVCVLKLHYRRERPWLGRNGSVCIPVPSCATFTRLSPTVHACMIFQYHMIVYVLDLHQNKE